MRPRITGVYARHVHWVWSDAALAAEDQAKLAALLDYGDAYEGAKEGSLIDMGVEQGFIRKSGSWFTYEGEQLGQGKENARTFLLENVDVANEIEKKIKEKLGIGAVVTDDEVLPAPVDF